jgi:hypothetical protein
MRVNWRWIIGIFFLLEVDSWQRIQGNKRVYMKKRDLNINEDNKYMEKLKEYDLKAQEYIINMGSFMYDKSREYFEKEFTEETVLEKWSAEYETQKVMEEKKKLEQKIRELRDELENGKENMRQEINKVRDDEREKSEKTINFLQESLERERKHSESFHKSINLVIKEKCENEHKYLKERIQQLEDQCKEYKDLYVEASKGKKYESELFPMLQEYNDKNLCSNWEITHVGNIAMKTDFLFKNKINGKTILLDTKNNNPDSGVQKPALDKFKRDVKRKENNAIGGILLANANIHTKKNFEINREDDKILIYIGCFNRENISLIFNCLDIIMELNKYKSKSEMLSIDNLKDLYKDQFNYETNKKIKLEKELNIIEDRIKYIYNEYRNVFDEDIELDIDNDSNKKQETSLDYEVLEVGRKIIGARSKHYHCYKENEEQVVEYFKTKRDKDREIKKRNKDNATKLKEKIINKNKLDKNIEIEVATEEES